MFNRLRERFSELTLANRIIVFSACTIILALSLVSAVHSSAHTITICDGDKAPVKITTYKMTVQGALDEQGIVLSEKDKLSHKKGALLSDNMNIEVNRAMMVYITTTEGTKAYTTTERVVGDILAELNLGVDEDDVVSPKRNKKISPYSSIAVMKTTAKIVTIDEEIPYETQVVLSSNASVGARAVTQEGENGKRTATYKVSYRDGEEVSRILVSSKVTKVSVPEIKEVGTRASYAIASAGVSVSRSGNLDYSEVLSMNATGYDISSCGKSPSHPAYGITATGRYATKGIVAVDPRVIPLGTRLYITSADGSYVYGYAIAADTGGAIKGNRIDLCFDSNAEALQFGRKNVKVYILQ